MSKRKPTDSKMLCNDFIYILDQYEYIIHTCESDDSGILAYLNTYIEDKVKKELSGISLEELKRVKSGIRVKYLTSAGYRTLADLYNVSVDDLEKINGISRDSANHILQCVNAYANSYRSNVKLRISTDDKNPFTTNVVTSVYRKKLRNKLVNEYARNVALHKNEIEQSCKNIKETTGFFKWLFASEDKKRNVIKSYDYLNDLKENGFIDSCKELIQKNRKIDNTDISDAWNDFEKDSISYFLVIERIKPEISGPETDEDRLPQDIVSALRNYDLKLNGLKCTLRRYQELGVRYILTQRKVLLGDEMGLGKTIQAIASMVALRNIGAKHFLVICPASVITNWYREIEKHSDLTAIKIHGAGRLSSYEKWKDEGGVGITTYETTKVLINEKLIKCDMVVVDEAHYIKNPNAIRTQNTIKICHHAERILFMTGTALENRVDEMVGLIRVLQPDIANKIIETTYIAAAPLFKEYIAPVYFRRKREDVLKELPELIENRDWCIMTPEEEDMYEETVLSRNFQQARRVSWNIPNIKYSSKANRLMEIVKEAEEDNRKVIVFSFFLDTISKIQMLFGEKCMPPITGSVPPKQRQAIIDEFEKAAAGTVLVAQIQSGGTGLNIQTASVVIICEPQFKPSIENQAISRAYRMGQPRNVIVYRLLCEDTVDERITGILEQKQRIFNEFADESVAAEKMEIDSTTFGKVMEAELTRIKSKRNIS